MVARSPNTQVTKAARAARGAARRAALHADHGFFGVALLALVAIPLPYLLRFDRSHLVTACVLAVVLFALCVHSRRGGALACLSFLFFLGDYRRYAGYFEGYPESDPLLLVGPAAAAFLVVCALADGRLQMRSGLAKLVAGLMGLMALAIFNPQQGGLQVGFSGALFYLAPLLWFWVGRTYASTEFMERLSLRILPMLGVVAAAWGLYQTRYGLFPFEQLWVERIGYRALYISDVVRSFAFFNSSAEYQRFLLVAVVTIVAAWSSGRSRLLWLLPVLLVALFLAAARGPIVMFAGVVGLLWALRAPSAAAWPPRLAVAAIAAAAALVATLLLLQSVSFGDRIAPLVSRQVEGLLDPGNVETSTARGHLQMIVNGIEAGFTSPAGMGLGATTIAASKYGATTVNAEFDFANVMLALGIVGGLLYAAVIVTVFRKALRWWRTTRDPAALTSIGILAATFGGWLIGGEYSMAALVWLYIGAMDGRSLEAVAKRRGRSRAARARHA